MLFLSIYSSLSSIYIIERENIVLGLDISYLSDMLYMIDMYYMISMLYMIDMIDMIYMSYQASMSYLYSMLLYVYDTIPIYFYIYVSRETSICETSICSALYSVL